MTSDRPAPHAALIEPMEPSRPAAMRYSAVQLHERSNRCWAVVGEPGGAIAEDETGALLMRLTADDARRMAAAMNGVLKTVMASAMGAALTTMLAEAGDDAPMQRRAVA